MLVLSAQLSDTTALVIGTYQDDDVWGLSFVRRASFDSAEQDGIFRLRALPELPTGKVDDVSVVLDAGALAEVVLTIQGRPLRLMAGEVEETMQGGLELKRLDESVLVFTDPSAAESLAWIPPMKDRRPW